MKTLFIKLTLFTIIAFTIFSCNKLDVVENTNEKNYNFYGEEHNKYIQQIITNKKSYSETELQDLYTQLKNSIVADFNIPETELPQFDTIMSYYNNFKNNTTLSNYESFSNLDNQQKIYINQLDSILVTEFSNSNLTSKIGELEQTIAEDNLLTENKKEIVFISTSIAKYSYNLWTSDGNECYAFPWQVVGADVIGGLIGGGFSGGNPALIVFCSTMMSIAAYADYNQNY